MTNHEKHNDANDFNSIDLNNLYNLNRCLSGECVSNVLSDQVPVPTLEELAQDRVPNPERNQALQSALNETAFMDSSPILGNPAQMYMPITKQQSEKYPTPAIVNEEIEQNDKNAQNIDNGVTATDLFVPYEVTRESLQYLNGFIRTQIGRRVTIDFLIGSDNLQSKTGYLLAVAQNYLLLNELDTNDVTACDLYTMKFIRFYY
jgi:hypothetical protein